jgi:hypothetical protein
MIDAIGPSSPALSVVEGSVDNLGSKLQESALTPRGLRQSLVRFAEQSLGVFPADASVGQ